MRVGRRRRQMGIMDRNIDLGPLALRYLLRHGGSGYFRTRVVQPYLESGQLHRVDTAPEFSYPIYLVYARAQGSSLLETAFAALRASVTEQGDAP